MTEQDGRGPAGNDGFGMMGGMRGFGSGETVCYSDYERKMLEYFKQMIDIIWCNCHKYH